MRIKQLLTKTLLAAAGLCVGASAWAQTTVVNIPFTGTSSTIENGATYNGTVGSMTFSQPSGNSFKITNDYMIVGTGTGTVTIAEADRAGYAHKAEGKNNDIVEISFSMAFGNTAANTYAGFEVLDEDDNVIVTLMSSKWSGINSSANTFGLEAADITTQTGNTTLWSQKTDFTIEFNYLIGKITCKTNNNSTGKSINMAAGKPVVAKYVLKSDNSRGDDTRQPFFSNLIIRNTEGDYTTATANYTINWVCSGSTVKTDVRNGAIDAAIDLTSADKAAFWVNTTKYYYVSDNSGSKTIAEDGSTVVEITVREANTWTATIKAIDSESNEIGDVKTATGIEGESVTVAHPKAAYLGGTWYECTSVNDYRHTLTEGSSSVDVTYDASSRIAYYFDNEDYYHMITYNIDAENGSYERVKKELSNFAFENSIAFMDYYEENKEARNQLVIRMSSIMTCLFVVIFVCFIIQKSTNKLEDIRGNKKWKSFRMLGLSNSQAILLKMMEKGIYLLDAIIIALFLHIIATNTIMSGIYSYYNITFSNISIAVSISFVLNALAMLLRSIMGTKLSQ